MRTTAVRVQQEAPDDQSKVRKAAEITAAAESGTPMTFSYTDRLRRTYRRRARPLSARSINMHIDLLAQILAVAVDHGRLASNPAVEKRRRMKVSKRRPVHLDSAEQIAILLEAAGDLDRGDNRSKSRIAMARPGPSARRSRRPAGARPSPRSSSAADERRQPGPCCGATSTSPTGGSRSAATRQTQGCGRSTCSRCCARS